MGLKRIDKRPVLFLEPIEPTAAEVIMNSVGDCSSKETGREIALTVSTQAIQEARIDVEKTRQLLGEMEAANSNWCMVQPVYVGCEPGGPQPNTEDRPANSSFWRALTKIIEPLRATLAPFTD